MERDEGYLWCRSYADGEQSLSESDIHIQALCPFGVQAFILVVEE